MVEHTVYVFVDMRISSNCKHVGVVCGYHKEGVICGGHAISLSNALLQGNRVRIGAESVVVMVRVVNSATYFAQRLFSGESKLD